MSKSVDHSLVKFRPVLTAKQISDICGLCNAHESSETKSILKVLVPILAKIEVGAINPAYKLSEIHQQKQTQKSEHDKYVSGSMTPEEESEYEARMMGI